MVDCEDRLDDWLDVATPAMWGTESPFNLVEGGKEGLMKKLLDVTSEVKMFPADKAPYGSHLMARIAARSELPVAEIAHLATPL